MGASLQVLLVDPADAARVETAEALERDGATVLQARTGHEALDIACRRRAALDVVVIEAFLCDMTERELVDALHLARPRPRKIVIVASTPLVLPGATVIRRPCGPLDVIRSVPGSKS